jgi:predicted nucleic acid-binding protein
MLPWSDNEINPAFEVKIFLDTNVWVFLIDKSYPNLHNLFEAFKENEFIRLVSSDYVVFEFSGVRKREHYLRQVSQKAKIADGSAINFSSLVNSQDRFDAKEVEFSDVVEDIKSAVRRELDEITRDYEVDFDYSNVHPIQLSHAIQLCLSTKINNQDSLVFLSAIHPRDPLPFDNIQVLTNDSQFVSESRIEGTGQIIQNMGYRMPLVQSMKEFKLLAEGTQHNLTDKNIQVSKQTLIDLMNRSIPDLIVDFNADSFLGRTFKPENPGLPPNLLCINLREGIAVRLNTYIVILSKDLEFVYTSKHVISDYQRQGVSLNDNFTLEEGAGNAHISTLLFDENGAILSAEIIGKLRESGNLVFLHPDSLT